MSTISKISVDFVANVANFSDGLEKMLKKSKWFSRGLTKDINAATKDLARIGAAGIAAGTALAAGLAAGVGRSISEIGRIKDEADKIGASASGLMALGQAAKLAGTDLETVKRGFVEIQKSINDAANGNEKAAASFAELGLSFTALSKKSPDAQFRSVIGALSRIDDANKRSAAGFDILGKSYTELGGLIKGGTAGLDEAAASAAAFGAVLANEDINRIAKFGDDLETLGEIGKGAFNLLTSGVAEAFGPALQQTIRWLGEGENAVLALNTVIQALATPVYMLLKAWDYLSAGIEYAQSAMSWLLGVSIKVSVGMIRPLQFVINAYDKLGEAVIEVFNLIIRGYNSLPGVADLPEIEYKPIASKFVNEFVADLKNLEAGAFQAASDYAKSASERINNGVSEKFLDGVAKTNNAIINAARRARNEKPVENGGGGVDTSSETPDFLGLANRAAEQRQIAADWSGAVKGLEERARAAESLFASVMTPQEIFYKKRAEIMELYEYQLIDTETKTRALAAAQNELTNATNPWIQSVTGIFSNFASGFEDAIVQARGFSDVLKGLAEDVYRVILRQMILKQLFNFGGSFFGIGDLGNTIFGGGRASGGSVYEGVAYRVGENGTETFVPETNGYIIPNSSKVESKSPNVVVNQTINVSAGVAQTVKSEIYSLIPLIREEVKASVVAGVPRGGSYRKAFAV